MDQQAARDKALRAALKASDCSRQATGIYRLAEGDSHLLFWEKETRTLIRRLDDARQEAEQLLGVVTSQG